MMAGNPNWWSMMNGMHPQQLIPNPTSTGASTTCQCSTADHNPPPLPPPPPQYNFYGGGSSSLSSDSLAYHHHTNQQDFPRSWSQLLMGGFAHNNEHERLVNGPLQSKKLENWEDQIFNPALKAVGADSGDLKHAVGQSSLLLYGAVEEDEYQANSSTASPSWSLVVPASSPPSCGTSLSTNLLNFSGSKADARNQQFQENSSECNSSNTGGANKKPRIQHSLAQPALKVRKEKLGDRITALHQLVSPFGKGLLYLNKYTTLLICCCLLFGRQWTMTDTASVLSEAFGYIRFLQAQIEQALSSPYLGNVSGGSMGHQSHHHQQQQAPDVQDRPKDLRSRGLCLVPISCTQHVGSETGADYWAPALGGGF